MGKAGQKVKDQDDFLDGGELRESAEKWPTETTVAGAAVIGKVNGFRTVKAKNGGTVDLMELSPVVVRAKKGADPEAYGSVGVFLGAALAQRVGKSDLGRVLAIRFEGERQGPNNKYMDYTVVVKDDAALRAALAQAGASDLPF